MNRNVVEFPQKRRFKLKKIHVIIILLIGIIYIVGSTYGYHLTVQRAFFWHFSTGSATMDEIIFIDEHEDSVTVRHWSGRSIYVSHYTRRVVLGIPFYRYTGYTMNSFILNPNPESVAFQQRDLSQVTTSGRPFFARDNLYSRINRRPLHGVSIDPVIHNLRINGHVPDHVGVSNVRRANPMLGEEGDEVTVYFWYFADFDWSFADDGFDPEDIVITFD